MRAYPFSADEQVKTGSVRLWGFSLSSGGDNDASLEIFDEADNSQTAGALAGVCRIQNGNSNHVSFDKACLLKNGCYVNITGTNARGILYIE